MHCKLYIVVVFCITRIIVQAQNCPTNLDFETGSFDGWECLIGRARIENGANKMDLLTTTPIAGRHDIMSNANTVDRFGGFPVLCPSGGKYSIKLGNETPQAEAEGITYTFFVPANLDTFTITYYYAIVLEDPSHPRPEQPRFIATAYDVLTGDIINCSSFDYVGEGGIPGFVTSSVRNNVIYKDWTPASLQFTGLQGRQVKLEFKTADCTRGGHFGYAYLDVASICSNILASAPYCLESNTLVLNAPFGFQSYIWYNQDFSKVMGNDRSLTLSPPPQTNGFFNVDLIPYPGYGCRDTLKAVIKPYPIAPAPTIPNEIVFCQFDIPTQLSAVALPNHTLIWYDSTNTNPLLSAPIPVTTNANELVYYVAQKELFGCDGIRKKVTVKIKPTPKLQLQISDSCVRKNIRFAVIDANNNFNTLQWSVNNRVINGYSTTQFFTQKTNVPIRIVATNKEGCLDSLSTIFMVKDNTTKALQDTIAIINQPMQLDANGVAGMRYKWSPSTGLNNDTLKNPIAILNTEITYQLTATSSEGCISESKIVVKRYKEADLYIADSFTPNNDGKNDILKVHAIGIKQFYFMEIYNRYGAIIFRTTDTQKGFNGMVNGKIIEAGTYIVVARAIDFRGNEIIKKKPLIVIK